MTRQEHRFDHEADVVVVGAGGAGLPAAIAARDAGASVLVIDSNQDVGGHAIVSGGSVALGGGTALQRRYGIDDSPDRIYSDITDPHNPQYRRSDRDLARVFADESVPTFDWLLENGVAFEDQAPTPQTFGRGTVPRSMWTVLTSSDWSVTINGRRGAGVVRPLEMSARRKGVAFVLRHRLVRLLCEEGRLTGLVASAEGGDVAIGARQGIVIATGGHSSNVGFRRMFDPRLTDEYQTLGEPWTRQDADGEIAAMDVGASLWGLGSQATEQEGESVSLALVRTTHIGCRWGYITLKWDPRSPVFSLARASGLTVSDLQDVILVNQTGQRFWNELDETRAFINACLGPNGDLGRDGKANGGGPIWAIFDSAAAERERWTCEPPHVDPEDWFFSAGSIKELARCIVNPHQRRPIDPSTLEATVERWNLLVEAGDDVDFGRPTPSRRAAALARRIQTPPFYAAWATPMVHDSLAGLRIDASCRVLDRAGDPIPGLYCAGESAGGLAVHGLPRAIIFGRVAGRAAALSCPWP